MMDAGETMAEPRREPEPQYAGPDIVIVTGMSSSAETVAALPRLCRW